MDQCIVEAWSSTQAVELHRDTCVPEGQIEFLTADLHLLDLKVHA
jgi:hypothetical protein